MDKGDARTIVKAVGDVMEGARAVQERERFAAEDDALGMAPERIKTWCLVVPDDVTGLAFQAAAKESIETLGGRVVATSIHPAGARDYALALRNARDSGADAVGLCAVGEEFQQQVKQARALGLFDQVRAVCAFAAGIADTMDPTLVVRLRDIGRPRFWLRIICRRSHYLACQVAGVADPEEGQHAGPYVRQ